MLQSNEKRILRLLKEDSVVLDIGGWDKPFNRANYVLDLHQFNTRGFHGRQGGEAEFFNENRWIIHDVNSKKKLPFKDKQFDFVICSHVMEDIRDPLWLCSEITRIGKAGYIEMPSMKTELSIGAMSNKYAGYYHHRWLTEIIEDKIIFRFKPHFIHNDKRFHFSRAFFNKLSEKDKVEFIFWKNKFNCEERIQISRDKVEGFIESFIRKESKNSILFFFLDTQKIIYRLIKKIEKTIFPHRYYHKYMDTEEIISK